MLRANLVFAGGGLSPRSIVVTSAFSNEGKTTTAANLAIAFAREGRRTLLLDCDLRRPCLHSIFRVMRSPGLAQVLEGRVTLENAIQGTPIENLFLLTCGEHGARASDLLDGRALHRLLGRLSSEFDMLVIDTPPALALADTTVLGTLADGVLLVVRAGATNRDAAEQVLRQLTNAGATVLGAVLNDPAGEIREKQHYYAAEYAAT